MKLVYLTQEAPREGQASYVHVHEIINGFKKQGVNVTLYQPSYTSKPVSPALIMRLLHAVWLQIKLWVGWEKGSVLYIRAHYLAFPSACMAKLCRIPVFHEINGPYEDVFVTHPSLNRLRSILIPMQRLQYKWANGLIAVTKELQDWANKEAERNDCAFISNGANTDLFKPGLPKPEDAPDQYVAFFGGLTRWHGVPIMLEAVGSKEWPERVKLLIIGDGQETPQVRKRAALNDRIVFLGRRPYKEVAAYVTNALAGLVIINNPESRSSTGVLPLKLYETLACGVPAIVTDLPGQANLVRDNDCGLVISQDDPEALASAVNALAKNPEVTTRQGQKGAAIIQQSHSWYARSVETLKFIQGKL